MFQIGDKVSYPMHGAGLITKIEEKQILGETHLFYIIYFEHGKTYVMVPVEGYEDTGLRNIVKSDALDGIITVLGGETRKMDPNWNRRNRDNLEHLRTGDLQEVAGVIRDLVRTDRIKKLSMGEKKLLATAKSILASELVMVLGKSEEEILQMIDEAI